MRSPFFDCDSETFIHAVSDSTALNSDGDVMLRMGDSIAMELDSGELHLVSGWPDEDE